MDAHDVNAVGAEQVTDGSTTPGPIHNEPVLVRFNPGTQHFDFDPETVVMDRPGKIVILKDPPQSRNWNLELVTITDTDRQFTIDGTSGVAIIVDDEHTALGTYCYTVTVRDKDEKLYTSPDPHIRNTNPTTGEPPGD